MEASETGTTPAKAGAGARILAVVAAIVMLFLAAVAVIAMADISGLTPCSDIDAGNAAELLNDEGECFDGSSVEKAVTLILGWPGAALAAVSVLLALGFAIRGRGGRLLALTVVAAFVLFGLSILVGSL